MNKQIALSDLAYVAGFIDGEGCITLVPHKPGGKRRDGYTLRVLITNTNKPVLVWIQSLFGGYLGQRVRRSRNHKISWELCVGSGYAEYMIQQIYPWLKMKKAQAEIGLKFRETVNKRRTAYDRDGVPREVRVKRDRMYREIHRLNRKGPG